MSEVTCKIHIEFNCFVNDTRLITVHVCVVVFVFKETLFYYMEYDVD